MVNIHFYVYVIDLFPWALLLCPTSSWRWWVGWKLILVKFLPDPLCTVCTVQLYYPGKYWIGTHYRQIFNMKRLESGSEQKNLIKTSLDKIKTFHWLPVHPAPWCEPPCSNRSPQSGGHTQDCPSSPWRRAQNQLPTALYKAWWLSAIWQS